MPAFNTLTIADREDTPVDHTFVPQLQDNGTAIFEKTDGIPLGNERLTVVVRRNGERTKASLVLAIPQLVTETINGVSRNAVDRTNYARVDFTFDNASTLQERKNVVGLVHNALADSQADLMKVFQNLESVY